MTVLGYFGLTLWVAAVFLAIFDGRGPGGGVSGFLLGKQVPADGAPATEAGTCAAAEEHARTPEGKMIYGR